MRGPNFEMLRVLPFPNNHNHALLNSKHLTLEVKLQLAYQKHE